MSNLARWKKFAAVVLIVLGCLVATISVAVIWLNQVILDTDKYVATVTPLSENPAIKDAAAAAVTDELFQRTHAEQLTREALPDRLGFLTDPIIGGLQGFVDEQIRRQLDSAEFVSVWKDSNRRAHEVVRQVLLGEQGTVYAEDGKIILDLSGLSEIAKARLRDRGITIFDDVSFEGTGPQFTIFASPDITRAQAAVRLLNRLAFWMPLAALAMLGAGLWLSRNRMTALLWLGLGLASGMVVMLIALSVGRNYYLDSIGSAGAVNVPAATSFFDIIMESLKTSVRYVFAGGLVVASAGFILSPYPLAVKFRASIWSSYRTAKDPRVKIDLGPAGAWIVRQKSALRAAGVLLALVILIAMDQPSLSWALLIGVVLIVYIGMLEFLARKVAAEPVNDRGDTQK
jgi:hypothetical protein